MIKKIGLFFILVFLMNLVVGAENTATITSVYVDPKLNEEASFPPQKFLLEEIEQRLGTPIKIVDQIDPQKGQILLVDNGFSDWPSSLSDRLQTYPLPDQEEGYRLLSAGNKIYIQGVDYRGLLYGIGYFLRKAAYADNLQWSGGSVSTAPDKSIRGHQLGYRNTANSYDAWTVNQYEKYIRDLIVFGTNSIENIPFEDKSIHFPISNRQMNIEVSRLSKKYQLDYWVWTPIEFDLNNKKKAKAYLEKSECLYKELPRLDAVFVPGGDPGDNPPELVLPMMKKMADLLQKYHPEAAMWLSLQGFGDQKSEYVYDYLSEEQPDWIGGLVAGPSSPSMAETRAALPQKYALRHYPDITHTVRCQYPNWWWDPAFNFTLGREPINPQPLRYQNIFLHTEKYTDGFITYSDGMHDDLNKMVWSQLGWNRSAAIDEIVRDYANYFLDSKEADRIADGLFALEDNWDGAIKYNGSITGTLELWNRINNNRDLDRGWEPWRWKMYLLRTCYDAFIRKRFIYEEELERQANTVMQNSRELGSEAVMDSVRYILGRSDKHFKEDTLRNRIYHLADDLFEVIGYQSSVPLYQAKNPERGAIIDFIDRPLNNRWWIESEFKRMSDWSEEQKITRLTEMGYWESPGKGSFYDDVGNIYKSSHVVKLQAPHNDPLFELSGNPGFDWWEEGYSKARLSWMSSMRWPEAMEYSHLNSETNYTLRLTGVGKFYTYADGEALEPVTERKKTGEVVELTIPQELTNDGFLRLTWQKKDESHLNWRQHSRLNEVWLIKN